MPEHDRPAVPAAGVLVVERDEHGTVVVLGRVGAAERDPQHVEHQLATRGRAERRTRLDPHVAGAVVDGGLHEPASASAATLTPRARANSAAATSTSPPGSQYCHACPSDRNVIALITCVTSTAPSSAPTNEPRPP